MNNTIFVHNEKLSLDFLMTVNRNCTLPTQCGKKKKKNHDRQGMTLITV